jgi:hypothetical protein
MDKFCDMLADEWDTLGMGICADRADFFPQFVCTCDDIFWENIRSQSFEIPVLHQRGYLGRGVSDSGVSRYSKDGVRIDIPA